jgi:hypothetical protein
MNFPGIDKQITFNTHGDGNIFAEAIDISSMGGGGLAKIAGEMHPEVSQFLKELRPNPLYQYVLMTPMGSFEYWGMNVNGDVFPEISLSYNHLTRSDHARVAAELEKRWLTPHGQSLPPGDWSKFGYKTFEEALRYRHHINKDPEISYGDIVLAVWNPRMHRVEVIVRHDREKAKRVGAEEIIADLDEGKPRQISMGCRVKFDVCTVCGHISRTTSDYCEHLKTMMGRILPDGRACGAVNFFPNFFDLSDVIVPAGKESGVLMKVAGLWVPGRQSLQSYPGIPLDAPNQLIKTASIEGIHKLADKDKRAELEKEILPNAGYDTAQQVARRDPDLPREMLEGADLKKLLATLAMLGIILKPREFQYAALHGHDPAFAKELDGKKIVFARRCAPHSMSIRHGDFCPEIAGRAAGVIPSRSAFMPHLGKRVIQITMIKEAGTGGSGETDVEDSNTLNKIAEAYDAYRKAVSLMEPALEVAVRDHFGYYQQNFFGDLLDRALTKAASVVDLASSRELTTGYLCGAFQDSVSYDPRTRMQGISSHSPASALLGH